MSKYEQNIIYMKVVKDDNRSKAVYIDKETVTHVEGNNIFNLKCIDIPGNETWHVKKASDIISNLNGFDCNEQQVYYYIINCLVNTYKIEKNYTNDVILNNEVINNIADSADVSNSSIRRAIKNLMNKRVISYKIYDNRVVPANYILDDQYNIVKIVCNSTAPFGVLIRF